MDDYSKSNTAFPASRSELSDQMLKPKNIEHNINIKIANTYSSKSSPTHVREFITKPAPPPKRPFI